MTPKPGSARYPLFFLGISLLFIAILAFAWFATRRANPIMLDEKGQPLQAHHS